MPSRYYVSFHYESDPDNMEAGVPAAGLAGIVLDLDIPVDTDESLARLTLVLMQNMKLANCVVLGLIPLKIPLIAKPGPLPILGPHGNVIGRAREEGLI